MKDIIKFFTEKDQFARHTGIELLEISEGYARAKLEIQKQHLNGVGIAHGGALFTLADLAFAAASNSDGQVSVAINANVSFLKALSTGTLYAEAKEVSKNRKIASYDVLIMDQDNDIIATFQGMVYRKQELISEYR
ncbi:MAG: PaaI family thioesterase [SAR324 cluster bacterium]|nr:PaaI family thioesterase [SAR324 cluster bacterium]